MTDRQPVQKNCRPQRRNIVPVNGGAAIGTAQKNDDEEFDPPVEMMIHDYDDERTLDEEEALEEPQDPQVEVSTLQRESDMPLEQLLAMYGYGDQGADNMQSSSSETSNHETTPENDEMERVAAEDEVEEKTNHSELQQLYIDHPEKSMDDTVGPARLLRLSRPQSEEDEDYDYIPDEEWRKTIMVGSDFQAAIPEGLCKYDDALPYENDDKLLWNPSPMMEDQIEEFLVKARESLQNNAQGVSVIPTGTHTRDDEQALYLLLQCGYNVEEALRRRRMNAVQPTDTMSLWSEEECTNFENGLRSYGKNFHLIQQNKVRTRSVGELVQFYYLWKKTERHDVFANKARLEKKKYNLHPGITDYMDRFLEEQESGVGTVHRDRSSSPNIHSLIYGDPKRHRVQDSPGETVISATSMSYPVDPLCELASHFDKESMESLVKFAEDGVRNTSASEAGSFAGGAGASSPPAASTFGSVEMAFSGTTVAAPVVLKAADSEHSSQATESVAQ